ncbi:MAG: MraY family glycosyltransferase [Bowdeniella nasicola]|nr:MraY family glycosyltransferase [Bowdeniella nasicola]
MKGYLLLMALAAAVTYLTTPLARRVAMSVHAFTPVRERDVHTVPVPRMGGLAMCLGLTVALLIGTRMSFLARALGDGLRLEGVLAASWIVCLVGMIDDVWDLDWMTKLAGQILAGGVLAWSGVQLVTFPIAGLTIGSSRLSLLTTVVVVVVAMNAVNFVDGLDGLAAGMVGIGALAFFGYCYMLTRAVSPENYSSLATAVVAVLVGVCVGFLPYNFHPASIFMGDAGSMVLGLMVAASTIIVTGTIDPLRVPATQAAPVFVPLLLPVATILLPLIDMVFAVARRVKAGQSPFHADRMHLHHRLLDLGHSHRRAVLIMYLWTTITAFSAASLIVVPTPWVLAGTTFAVVIGAALTKTYLSAPKDSHD